jgi:hypothetical protein
MRRSRFTEEQITMALRQAEAGTPVEEICRKREVSQASFFRRKKQYGGMGVSELRELRQPSSPRSPSTIGPTGITSSSTSADLASRRTTPSSRRSTGRSDESASRSIGLSTSKTYNARSTAGP